MDASSRVDDLALQPHEKYDVHINVEAATTLHPNQRPNVDHDAFFSRHAAQPSSATSDPSPPRSLLCASHLLSHAALRCAEIYKSPYQTPAIVERHQALAFVFATFIRVMLVIWYAPPHRHPHDVDT